MKTKLPVISRTQKVVGQKPDAIAPDTTRAVNVSFKDTMSMYCPNLINITIKYISTDNDATIGVIEDSSGNALQTFTIIQPDKELFYDKLKKALNTLCDSASIIDTLIKSYKSQDPDLYTTFLENKNNLDNTNGLAGILDIRKNIWVHGLLKDNQSKKGGNTTSNTRKVHGKQKRAIGQIQSRLDSLINALRDPSSKSNHSSEAAANKTNVPSDPTYVSANSSDSNFTIQSIQIQFQDDFIENIKIFGKIRGNNHLFRFENIYPIGFSTKRDFRNLIETKLLEKSDYINYSNMYLKLGEVLSYSQNLANDNKDYSPANQVLTINAISDSVKEVSLYKDQTSKILELQVFSDLKGADNNNPNGLIQLELNKKLNFFSQRYNATWKILPWHWGNGKTYENKANFGLFNYITPQFSIDKIENNQKRLILNHIDTLSLAADTSKALVYASTINLMRHQIYSVGMDLSWLLFDIPNIKSTINIGTGFHFGRTALQDTLRTRTKIDSLHYIFQAAPTNNVQQYGINTFQWGPYITWQIFPDSRFGVSATQRFTWFKALSNNFVQVRDSAQYLKFIARTLKDQVKTTTYPYYDYSSNNWFIKNIAKPFSLFTNCIASTEIFAYFSPNSDGSNKLFFRYRINWDLANAKENFHQVQVGFSTYLTATKEYNKLKKAANID
jgi:hypothetical protein